MDIFELAAELGKALKADERLERLEAAKNAYVSDAELQKSLVEYEVQQNLLRYFLLSPLANHPDDNTFLQNCLLGFHDRH